METLIVYMSHNRPTYSIQWAVGVSQLQLYMHVIVYSDLYIKDTFSLRTLKLQTQEFPL